MLMNVQKNLTTVIFLLTVLTLWEATPAHVKLVFMEMELPAQVSYVYTWCGLIGSFHML